MNDSNMLVFRKLDDSLIRMYKIGSSYSLYDNDVEQLFKNDDVIRIQIPLNYEATVIYKLDNGNFAKTLQFPFGSYDLKKKFNDKNISQINVKNVFGYNQGPLLYNQPGLITNPYYNQIPLITNPYYNRSPLINSYYNQTPLINPYYNQPPIVNSYYSHNIYDNYPRHRHNRHH
jgi:hypothetical protein